VLCVVEVLVIIQYSILLVRSGYTGNVYCIYGGIKGSMYKVMKSFICRGRMIPVTGIGCTSVDIGVNANLQLVD